MISSCQQIFSPSGSHVCLLSLEALLLLFVCLFGEKFETLVFSFFQEKMATQSGIVITPDSFSTFRDTVGRINDDHLGEKRWKQTRSKKDMIIRGCRWVEFYKRKHPINSSAIKVISFKSRCSVFFMEYGARLERRVGKSS